MIWDLTGELFFNSRNSLRNACLSYFRNSSASLTSSISAALLFFLELYFSCPRTLPFRSNQLELSLGSLLTAELLGALHRLEEVGLNWSTQVAFLLQVFPSFSSRFQNHGVNSFWI